MKKLDPKTDGASKDITAENTEALKHLFPECITEGKVDFEVLRELLGDEIDERPERYNFTWNGKSLARRIAQTPSTGTLRPCPAESVNWEIAHNVFIEGDNLEVLKLLQKSYYGCVKVIYIDPPYNTGKEFIYPDKYQDNLGTYLKYSGQTDEDGLSLTANAETSGRFHTNWLNMIYPRVRLARNLLREDGAIFISIDDKEVANLRKLCDEVFGEENFVATFIWEKRTTRENRKVFSFNHDFVLCYARNKPRFEAARKLLPLTEEVEQRYENPDDDPRGVWQSVSLNAQAGPGRRKEQFYSIETPGGRVVDPPPGRCWLYTRERMDELIRDNRVWFGAEGNNVPREKVFLSEARDGLTPHTLWKSDEVGTTESAKKGLTKTFDNVSVFDTPKPVELLERIVRISMESGDMALDFFAGAAPLAEAVIRVAESDQLDLRFMLVQLPEPINDTLLQSDDIRAMGLNTIADIAKERIRRVFSSTQNFAAGGIKVFSLGASNITPWGGSFDNLEASLFESVESIRQDRTEFDVVYELLLKFGLDLTVPVEHREIEAKSVYIVGEGALIICLADGITLDLVEGIAALKAELEPEIMRVVFKDAGFPDDVVKTNTVQILRQAGVDDVKSL